MAVYATITITLEVEHRGGGIRKVNNLERTATIGLHGVENISEKERAAFIEQLPAWFSGECEEIAGTIGKIKQNPAPPTE